MSKNASKEQNQSHLANLVKLAYADGHISEIEEHLLFSIAHRLGLEEADVAQIKSTIHEIEFHLPAQYDDRIEQFTDLLTLMAIDDEIDEKEERYIRQIGERYQLTERTVNEMMQRFM